MAIALALAMAASVAVGCSSSDPPASTPGGASGTAGATGLGGTPGTGGGIGTGGVNALGGSSGSGSSGAGSSGTGSSGTDVLLGGFTITLVAEVAETPLLPATVAHTTFLGRIYDGASPATTIWTPVESSGGCELSTPKVPYCSKGCASGQACVGTGVCATYPAAQSVGTVVVKGLGADFTLQAGPGNTYQPDATVELAYPPFAEGAAVQIDAAGGALAPFVLQGKGIAPIKLSSTSYDLSPGAPLALAWTAGSVSAARIKVHLDISHHGGSKGRIECDVADTGSLSISASLITKLIALGVAGFPTIRVSREFTSETTVATGRVRLSLASPIELAVTVPGVQSCTDDSECSPPKTCRADLTCG